MAKRCVKNFTLAVKANYLCLDRTTRYEEGPSLRSSLAYAYSSDQIVWHLYTCPPQARYASLEEREQATVGKRE